MKAIAVESIEAWLDQLSQHAQVLVPRRDAEGEVALLPRTHGQPPARYRRLAQSPKNILVAQAGGDSDARDGASNHASLILFGLRPCDAAAIEILDNHFSRVNPDIRYQRRRAGIRLIVVACAESEDTCFCTSTGTGPVAAQGYDVQLVDCGKFHLALPGSSEGERMIDQGGELFRDAPADAHARLDEFRRRSREDQYIRLDLDRAQDVIRRHAQDQGFWDSLGGKCLMCGGCTYLCPTCTCSQAVADVPDGSALSGSALSSPPKGSPPKGEHEAPSLRDKERPCRMDGYIPEPAGRTPRGHRASRCGHRYMHKLGGSDMPKFAFRCVGCGRCVDVCLTCAGIIAVVHQLLEFAATSHLATSHIAT